MTTLALEHELTRDLIRCPSVTPAEGGALDLIETFLEARGFTCHRLVFGEGDKEVQNLFAIRGESGPHFGFAGHTDVVPPGATEDWTHDPFSGAISDGMIHGRGAADMKGAVGAFLAAVAEHLENKAHETGRISLLITGDEEGDAINGTNPVLKWMHEQGLMADVFLVGEPTNPNEIGDMIKHGRRGSLSGTLEVEGKQGHVAYPHLAENPLPRLMRMLAPLAEEAIDDGNAHFGPSTAAITSIDTGNPVRNVIPQKAVAMFNIRYSSDHSAESLKAWLTRHFDEVGGTYSISWHESAAPFITNPGKLTDIVTRAVAHITGRNPELSTSGGTSDARFIAAYADVVEFGLVGQTMHQINEHTSMSDVTLLKRIYADVLDRFFTKEKGK
ncbi:succinyl-diaminopimelate desuccinylase [Alphaproteobacteria bacterium LSUCC0684]